MKWRQRTKTLFQKKLSKDLKKKKEFVSNKVEIKKKTKKSTFKLKKSLAAQYCFGANEGINLSKCRNML